MVLSFVIPGRRAAANPESINTDREYGFRARAHSASKTRVNALMARRRTRVNALIGAPRNDGGEV
jgi:hypothetical protein